MMFVCFQGHKYGRRKPTETSVSEFSYLCVNSSLEEVIKIKSNIYSKTRSVYLAKSTKIRNVFNPHKSFPGLAPKAWLNQGLPGCKTG